MAARGSGRRAPICHDQQEKVMNALEAANYEVRFPTLLFLDMILYTVLFLSTHT